MLAVCKQELRSFFSGMTGWALTAFLTAASALYFTALELGVGLTDFGYYTLYNTLFVLLVWAPVAAMRSLAAERRDHTDQLLWTSPTPAWAIVLGKYLALCALFALPCLFDAAMILTLRALGATAGATAANFACLLCYYLLGCAALAVCLFLSGLTETPLLAGAGGFGVLLLAFLLPSLRGMLKLGSPWLTEACGALLGALSFFAPFETFVNGTFSLPALVYYLSAAGLFLFFTVWHIARRRGARRTLRARALLPAAVALALLANLAVGALPAGYASFDLSAGGLYTLGDSSRAVAEGLEQDVTLYYLCPTGTEDAILTGLLDQYADASPHIRWEQKDPDLYPTFGAQYGEGVSAGSLIVDAGERSAVLDPADLYLYEYTDYATGSYTVRFDGEGQITAAIYRLTSGPASHAYYTANHGEKALSATLLAALEAQNLEARALNLLSDPIPEDCDLLIINCPAADFTGAQGAVDELALLESYLDGGGKLLIATDGYYDTPGLDGLLARFGLERVEGLVVEGDAAHCLYGYSYYLLPDHAFTTESAALDGLDPTDYLLLQMAQGIRIEAADGVTAEPLLTTSAAAYSKAAGYDMTTTEREEGDIDGPFSLAVYAREEASGAEVIWLGCSNMDDEALYLSVPANCDFLVGCAASLAGQRSDLVIDPKAMEAALLTIPAGTAAAAGITFLLAVPVGLLAAGAVVSLRRRRR